MIYVTLGTKHKNFGNNTEIHGGSGYGAGTIAIQGSETPTKLELEVNDLYPLKSV
jgi:hypothetical protein